MDNVTLARATMGTSLGFHIVFAALGVGLPLLMLTAEGLWLRTRDDVWLNLARRWSKAFGILFAVGAVSGTALSFELGLLWPRFMAFSGAIFGLPFSAEGFAFFIEAIFLGLYLYGWNRLTPFVHWLTSIPILISGITSAELDALTARKRGEQLAADQVTTKDKEQIDTDPAEPVYAPRQFESEKRSVINNHHDNR